MRVFTLIAIVALVLILAVVWRVKADPLEFTCCICLYQSDDPFSWLFRSQCEDRAASPEWQSQCDNTEIRPYAVQQGGYGPECNVNLSSGCENATRALYHYYGHSAYIENELLQVCIDNSCSVYGVNTACSTLTSPEECQEWLNNHTLPPGVRFEYTGMQCTSAGGASETFNLGGIFSCANAECTIKFGCTAPEFVQCERLDSGLCVAPGETVQCTNATGGLEYRHCCGSGTPIPGTGFWRVGTDCHDVSAYNCPSGKCCTCGSNPQTGQPCQLCKDSVNSLGIGGSRATITFTKYKEVLDCSTGQCQLRCDPDGQKTLSGWNGAQCGTWMIYGLPQGTTGTIKKDCSENKWSWTNLPVLAGTSTGYSGITRETGPSCSASVQQLRQQFTQTTEPPSPESDCNHYEKKEYCAGELKTTVEILVETQNTAMCPVPGINPAPNPIVG